MLNTYKFSSNQHEAKGFRRQSSDRMYRAGYHSAHQQQKRLKAINCSGKDQLRCRLLLLS